jgi:hypothetical protein
MEQLVAMLQERGLIEVYVDDQGREAYRLTDEGVKVGTCSPWSPERTPTPCWRRCSPMRAVGLRGYRREYGQKEGPSGFAPEGPFTLRKLVGATGFEPATS